MFYTVFVLAGEHHARRSDLSPLPATGQPLARLGAAPVGMVLNATATAAPLSIPRWTWARLLLPMRAMDAPVLPEVQLRGEADDQLTLALASEGVLRYVWHSRYGDMLIEVRGEEPFVNGQRVERHQG